MQAPPSPSPNDREGLLAIKPQKKGWKKKYVILRGDFLYFYKEKPQPPAPGAKEPKEPKTPTVISLKDANFLPVEDKEKRFALLIETMAKTYSIGFESETEKKAWFDQITLNTVAARDIDRLTPTQEKAVAEVQKQVDAAVPFDRKSAIRFLRAVQYDVNRAVLFYNNNVIWRKNFGADKITVATVYPRLKAGEFVLTGGVDKRGRPVVISRARMHESTADFLEILSTVVYVCERALRETGAEEAVLVYDLNGFDKNVNADNRCMKFLLDVFQYHYPGRVAHVYVLNCPLFYRLLWRIVKPWLTGDLLSKVCMCSIEDLPSFITKQNLLPEHGGTLAFDFDKWAAASAAKEGVLLDAASIGKHPISPLFKPILCEVAADESQKGATRVGWMKKQGGVIKHYNKRLCVVRSPVFYYFYTEKDKKAEGAIPLYLAHIEERKTDEPTVFHIMTYVGKDCIFDAETVAQKKEWIASTQDAIDRANQLLAASS